MNEPLTRESIAVPKKSYAVPVITESETLTFAEEILHKMLGDDTAYQCFHCQCGGHD